MSVLKGCLLLILVMLLCFVATRSATAQSVYGTIVGIVTDASGAVVPDAKVEATQTETNEKRTTATNDTGVYTLATVPAGTYVVSISKSGFDVFEARGIDLTINTTVRVDAKLAIGGGSVTLNVRSDAAELQTDRVDVHGVIASDDLQQLPQPTRTYQGLIGLLPGVTPPNPGFAGAGGTNNPARSMVINVSGTGASGTNVSIDGVSATNAWVQFYSTAVPSTEAIETVNVVTASSSADQGIMNGGGIRVQIKSGTNSFHGSAYWYNENNAINAKPYFQPVGTRTPKYIDNDVGATLGGPIVKDKLFFLVAMRAIFCVRLRAISTRCLPQIWPAVFWLHRLRSSILPQEMQMAAAGRPFRKTLPGTTSFLPVESAPSQRCSLRRSRQVFPMACSRTTSISILPTPITCRR